MKFKFYLFTFILAFIAVFIAFNNVQAEDYPFDPNYIISDAQMFDYNSMTLGEIQHFLQNKGSSLAWLITEDHEGNKKTAAEIIYLAANEYKVNPKLLLAFLQKEQSLITLENPKESRLDWAMGYGACDGCSGDDPRVQKYKGFGKQVDNAAGAMRFYSEHANEYGFIRSAGESKEINGQILVFKNQATANLYTYTPHLWGNELFSFLFNKYFESPLLEDLNENQDSGNVIIRPDDQVENGIVNGSKYKAEIVGRGKSEIWADEGQHGYYWVEYQNTGDKTWFNQDFQNLYMLSKNDLSSSEIIPRVTDYSNFNNSGVLQSMNIIPVVKSEVKPGGILRVTIKIDPSYIKTESFSYVLVLGGHGYFPNSEVNFKLSRRFNYDAQLTKHNYPDTSGVYTDHNINLTYKNVGIKTWTKDDVFLQWKNLNNNSFEFVGMNEDMVHPGETATFTFINKVKEPELYKFSLDLYKQVNSQSYDLFPTGKNVAKIAVNIDETVDNSNLAENDANQSNTEIGDVETVATVVDDSNYSYDSAIDDGSFAADIIDVQMPVGMTVGSRVPAYITVKNVGKKVWTAGDMVLRSYDKIDPFTGSRLYDYSSWVTTMAVEKINKDVRPGETYTFHFYLKAPQEVTMIKNYWQLEWGSQYQEIPINGSYNKIYNIYINE